MSNSLLSAVRSTLPLSEVARHVVVPEGIVDTLWYEVEERCREWGDSFDVWQDGLGQLMLGLRADGKYAATVGGETLSLPRQVAKTFMVGRVVFGLSTIFPDTTALWTAHRVRTATQTFQKLAGFAQRKSVAPYLAVNRNDGIRSANGEQEIQFRNGSRILFGAREQGFGRGFDEVDIEVFDEAQILTEKALEDMVPATNQSRNPHGALLIFMGTPPRPVDPGEAFESRRSKALKGKPAGTVLATRGNSLYVECSADSDVGREGGPSLDDPLQVGKANPSYPHRTPQESIDRMRENLSSDDAWRREALGVWDELETVSRAITADEWSATESETKPEGVKSFGVAFSFKGDRVSVAGAAKHDGGIHVELIDASEGDPTDVESGLGDLADWLAERRLDTAMFVLAGSAHAAVLAQLLRDRDVPSGMIRVATTKQYLEACAMTLEAVRSATMTHLQSDGQAVLDESVAVCDTDKRGGFVASTAGGDETPLEAVSLALWAARTTKRKPRGTERRTAVIL